MTNIRPERGDITTDPMEIKRIRKEYYEQVHAHKFDNHFKKMDQFLEKQSDKTHTRRNRGSD